MDTKRRLVPDEPFPPYSYVNGKFPHPIRDPAGHSFGVVPAPCPVPDPNHWRDCRPYLYGLDLFNHGYYWEAHEVWEQIWHAAGRTGPVGSFIKGLIKLAAAGVKVREGRPDGVRSHARRAAELFSRVAEQLQSEQPLSLSENRPGRGGQSPFVPRPSYRTVPAKKGTVPDDSRIGSSYFGLSLPRLIELANDVARDPPTSRAAAGAPVEIVFPFVLRPEKLLS